MRSWLRAHRILMSVLAVLLLAYALAGFFLVPRIARAQAEAFVTETLQRKITIGEIRFNPFTLAVEIADLKLTEADGTPLAALRRLYLNAELASLWRRGVVLQEIELEAPDIEVIVAPDGSLNLARLAPPAAQQPQAPKTDAEPLRVQVGRLAVSDGRVGFQDRSRAQPFNTAFTPIRFALTDFRTDLEHRNAYSFTASSRLAGKFEWAGGFTVQPLGASGTFAVSDLRLAAIDEFLQDRLPVEVVSGNLQLRGNYNFALQPLSLEVALPLIGVRDLVVAERGVAAAPPIAVPEIDVQHLAFSLARRDVGMRRIDVRGARIEVVREADGSLNLARLAAPPAPGKAPPAPKPAAPKEQGAPWTVHADAISVEAASVVAEDRTVSPAARFQLAPIGISVSGLTTRPGTRMTLDARIGIEKQGRLALGGEVGLEPLSVALALDLQKFPLRVLQPYLSQATSLTLHSGSLGVKSKLSLAATRAGAPPAARVSADVRIDELRATDDLVKEDLVKWRSLVVGGIQFQQRPDRLRIDRIVAEEPYARVIISQDGTTNLARALTPPAGAKPAPEKPQPAKPQAGAAPPMQIAIRTVQVVEGSANFADYSIQPSFASGIVGLNGQVEGLSSAPDSRAKIAIKGRVDEFSPVEINGAANLLSGDVYTDLAVSFRNIELTTFNPYSGKFAGYNITKGKLSTELKYRVEHRKLDAHHHIVVDSLEFGERTGSKDAASIPIKLGVALLKDKRGIIEIDLPVSGTLDDPKFDLMPAIWNAIVNLLAKLITAPFRALAGDGGEHLAFVDFEPGAATLGEASAKKLGTLSKSLVERPELKLNVPLTVATAADSEAMASQALRTLVPAQDSKSKRIEALEAAYRVRLKTAPEYPKEMQGDEAPKLDARIDRLQAALLERLKPEPAALEALGRERASAVRGALLANKELKPERVFIVAKPVEAAPAAGLVRMEMKLE
jgi:uncharacterized protein involved in outer membrane biogenesis